MEDNSTYLAFLNAWHQFIWVAFFASLGAASVIFITYKVKFNTANSFKERYDIAAKHEVTKYLHAHFAIAAALFFLINLAKPDTIELSVVWFFIRMFMGVCIATLYGYVAYLLLNYYYPTHLNKKLKKLRYTPRVNPKTGHTMKLLSEAEEDVHLGEGMQAEENAFSVDYDVWLDTQSGDTIIEKYKGYLDALECDECRFQTLKVVKESLVKESSATDDGEVLIEYKCTYCGRIKRKSLHLSKKSDKEVVSGLLHQDQDQHQIQMIKVEIIVSDGNKSIYEFQNLRQAQQFLEEFELNKVE